MQWMVYAVKWKINFISSMEHHLFIKYDSKAFCFLQENVTENSSISWNDH